MNIFTAYLINLAVTLLIALLLTLVLRTALWRVLLDLCATQDRAQFWSRFAMIMLIAMPMATALGYTPESMTARELFFETARQLRGNLWAYLFALAITGGFIAVFALFAPRTRPQASD